MRKEIGTIIITLTSVIVVVFIATLNRGARTTTTQTNASTRIGLCQCPDGTLSSTRPGTMDCDCKKFA